MARGCLSGARAAEEHARACAAKADASVTKKRVRGGTVEFEASLQKEGEKGGVQRGVRSRAKERVDEERCVCLPGLIDYAEDEFTV
eukprot:804360-Pleurochrysis_carterae.AAC.1